MCRQHPAVSVWRKSYVEGNWGGVCAVVVLVSMVMCQSFCLADHVRVDTDADIQLSAGARFFAESGELLAQWLARCTTTLQPMVTSFVVCMCATADFASIVATSSLRLKTAAAAGVEATGNSAQLDAPVGGNVKLAPGGGESQVHCIG